MAAGPKSATRIVSVPTEMEAVAIVARLESEGIEAWTEGALTAAFRAEAPGMTMVYVRAVDAGRAAAILREEVDAEPAGPQPISPPTKPGPIPKPLPTRAWTILVALLLAVLLLWIALSRF